MKLSKCRCAFIGVLLSLPALADDSTSLSAIADAARRTGDKSRQALVSIFGDVVNNPLAAGTGGSDTILASLFQVVNTALLVVAGMFATYVWFRKLSKVAHDGIVFDRAQHAMWGPIRLVWGISSLVPTANGWALSQLLMLWAGSLLGVGIANMGTDASIAAFADGKSMVVQPAAPETMSLAKSVYEMNLCMHGINTGLRVIARSGGLDFPREYVQQFDIPNGFILKNPDGNKVCGGAVVDATLLASSATSTSWFGPSVDASPIYRAHLDALKTMQITLRSDAQRFVEQVAAQMDGATVTQPDSNLAVEHAALEYERSVNLVAQRQMSDVKNLAVDLSSKIKDTGWWSLGAWYQTFAVANSKLSDAVAGKAQLTGESFVGDPGVAEVRTAISKAYQAQLASNTDAVALGQTGATGTTDTAKFIGSFFSQPGQKLLYYMTNADFGSSGGGTTNPLIKMKNIGDYTLVTAEVATGTFVALSAATEAAKSSVGGMIVDKAFGVGSFIKGGIDAIRPFFLMIIIPLFLLGGGLSIYLPIVPFIVWFGAIINWLVVVLEGIVAAPLWAMAHIDGEGEGLGGKSSHGYYFLLNLITRPFLMVVGFLGGGASLVVGGTFLNEIFGIAVANVQFSSVTGLVSLLGFLYIYFSMCVNLVHSCFGLIFIVPDQVINWVGGQISSRIGRDDNESVRGAVNVLVSRLDHMRRAPELPGSGTDKPGNGVKR
ncbi:DotA/TraY family protein [Rugamonas apoptosis]|uniref:DotA/TraY family protein n=1 Tax=Rugamonas apoptosis TaxID=2758570 RepID=A0A7W2FF29_9BURK|nr:DotA/TraY family protein [Rugamonas apoptosis]MBA5690547.1 DotA/TraY family protein [Rugamonas apoptosis]